MARGAVGAVVVAVLGLAALVAFRAGERARPTAQPVVAVSHGTTSAPLTVHVAGAVARPGLVVVPAGARLADAIAAAGGATGDAELAAVNLAEPLTDGTRVVVPVAGDDTAPADGDGRVRLATATAEELTTLPGIGPVIAGRIVAHREEVGGFRSVEDLLDVPGIGERLLAGLADLVVP